MHHALNGKHIMITRSLDQSVALAQTISDYNGIPILFPCLEVEVIPHAIRDTCDQGQNNHADVLFTSRNGVTCVASVLGDYFHTYLSSHRVTAVGPRTARALNQYGIEPSLIPEVHSQQGLIDAYQKHGMPEKVLFFRAEEGSELLATALQFDGCEVITCHAYRTICPQHDADDMRLQLQQGNIDAILLGSGKTARHYLQRIGDLELAKWPVIAVISPQVAKSCADLGLNVQVIAKTASFEAMLDGLATHFENLTEIQE
ncbi:MAG: uroporphyrinogen-III synthase [Mariprofundaceae bacterium]